MKESFEFYLKSIIKRLTKQIIVTTSLFLIFLLGGIIFLLNEQLEIAVIVFIFTFLFFILTIIDCFFVNSNKKSLKLYPSDKALIAKKLNRQKNIYASRGRGLIKLLLVYIYKPLIKLYEQSLELLQIEE